MPETSFYISDEERGKLFEYITSIDGKLIADKIRITTALEYVSDYKEFLQIIEDECVGFFITSRAFTTQPLLSEQNRYLTEPSFSISQRYGGPYIGLSLYRGFAKDDAVKYKRTDIFHYPKYINLKDYFEEIPASKELKQYYKLIVDYLKSRCKSVSVNSKKYQISIDIEI
jgi:hypothetical protein